VSAVLLSSFAHNDRRYRCFRRRAASLSRVFRPFRERNVCARFFFLAMVDDENVRWKKLMRDVDFNNFSITHTQE
jgi:hypothetical protein